MAELPARARWRAATTVRAAKAPERKDQRNPRSPRDRKDRKDPRDPKPIAVTKSMAQVTQQGQA